jgi:hypothetical protein
MLSLVLIGAQTEALLNMVQHLSSLFAILQQQ